MPTLIGYLQVSFPRAVGKLLLLRAGTCICTGLDKIIKAIVNPVQYNSVSISRLHSSIGDFCSVTSFQTSTLEAWILSPQAYINIERMMNNFDKQKFQGPGHL